jgi:TRAP transporter TAXI family solute receptor
MSPPEKTAEDRDDDDGHDSPAWRAWVTTSLPFVTLGVLLIALAYWWLEPTPPKRVVMATGTPQGAYAEFGKRYAERLAVHGIQVELRETQGAADNLALLREDKVDIAFVQGGAGQSGADEPPLQSLGSVFYEPVWLFYRQDFAQQKAKQTALASLTQLAGASVNIGAPGSGVSHLAMQLFAANGLDQSAMAFEEGPLSPAIAALLEGRLDAVVMASAPESLLVQMLLQTPGIALFDFAQADAYTRRLGYLSAVTLPRGVIDLARDLPPADVRMVAPTATLVVREGLHPALAQLFVQAARKIHGEPGWFQRKGDFPNAIDGERSLAPEAERFYKSGVPWLQRYLPFWLANLIDRMWLAMVSIIAVLIPLSRIVPPLVELRIRSRVFRWYGQLRDIEHQSDQGKHSATAVLLPQIDAIEAKLEDVKVPLSYADELYTLRSHIQLVRKRLLAREGDRR